MPAGCCIQKWKGKSSHVLSPPEADEGSPSLLNIHPCLFRENGNPFSPIHSGGGRNLESADEILLLFKQNVQRTNLAQLHLRNTIHPHCLSPENGNPFSPSHSGEGQNPLPTSIIPLLSFLRKLEPSLPHPFWCRPESTSSRYNLPTLFLESAIGAHV